MTAMSMVQAINSALDCTMGRDPNVLVMGQDVGYFGGVFRCTEGLYQKYGAHRALDTPIAEGGIVAAAIGMGVNGLRPVVEMQFADYIYPAIDQIISELARLRHRSGGEFWAPVVVRPQRRRYSRRADPLAEPGGDLYPRLRPENRDALQSL